MESKSKIKVDTVSGSRTYNRLSILKSLYLQAHHGLYPHLRSNNKP